MVSLRTAIISVCIALMSIILVASSAPAKRAANEELTERQAIAMLASKIYSIAAGSHGGMRGPTKRNDMLVNSLMGLPDLSEIGRR